MEGGSDFISFGRKTAERWKRRETEQVIHEKNEKRWKKN